TPEGAFYLYPNCSALIGRRRPDGTPIGSDDDFSLYLLDQARVAVVQGSAYGLSPHFRISIATSMDLIEKAIGRIAKAVEALR
ncbi:MAG: aminotransferase class I/II-fold pyridoxal phosphate-dependent enzyme, partial [Mesorhizobium sp.]